MNRCRNIVIIITGDLTVSHCDRKGSALRSQQIICEYYMLRCAKFIDIRFAKLAMESFNFLAKYNDLETNSFSIAYRRPQRERMFQKRGRLFGESLRVRQITTRNEHGNHITLPSPIFFFHRDPDPVTDQLRWHETFAQFSIVRY